MIAIMFATKKVWMLYAAVLLSILFGWGFTESASVDVDLVPLEPQGILGDSIQFICVAKSSISKPKNVLSSQLSFVVRLKESGPWNRTREYTHLINDTAIKLFLPSLTTEFNDAIIQCGQNRSHLLVGERPFEPMITNLSVLNWKELRVTWKTNHTNLVYRTCYDLWIKTSVHSDYRSVGCNNTCNKSRVKCRVLINQDDDKIWSLMVKGTSPVGRSASQSVEVNLDDIVVPDAVQDFRVLTTVDGTFAGRIVSSRPGKNFLYEINYNITDANLTYRQIIVSNDNVTEFSLSSDLPADFVVFATVRARPVPLGQWSNSTMSNPSSFTTPQKVPLLPVEIYNGSFEVIHGSSSTVDVRDIVLFYQLPDKFGLRGKALQVEVTIIDNIGPPVTRTESLSGHNSSSWIRLRQVSENVDHYVTLNVATDAGYNGSLHLPVVIIPATSSLISWEDTDNLTAISSDSGSNVVVSWHDKRYARQYTVLWCEIDSSSVCQGMVNFIRTTRTSTIIDLPQDHDQDQWSTKTYKFGVSAEMSDGRLTGIKWIDCLYYQTAVEVSASEDNVKIIKTTDSAVILEIRRAECTVSSRTGFIYGYRISWWTAPRDTDFSCQEAEQSSSTMESKTVNASISVEVVIDRLRSNQSYCFRVKLLTFKTAPVGVSLHILTAKTATQSSKSHAIVYAFIAAVLTIVCLVVLVVIATRKRSLFTRLLAKCPALVRISIDIPPTTNSHLTNTVSGSSGSSEPVLDSNIVTKYLASCNQLYEEEDRDHLQESSDMQLLLLPSDARALKLFLETINAAAETSFMDEITPNTQTSQHSINLRQHVPLSHGSSSAMTFESSYDDDEEADEEDGDYAKGVGFVALELQPPQEDENEENGAYMGSEEDGVYALGIGLDMSPKVSPLNSACTSALPTATSCDSDVGRARANFANISNDSASPLTSASMAAVPTTTSSNINEDRPKIINDDSDQISYSDSDNSGYRVCVGAEKYY